MDKKGPAILFSPLKDQEDSEYAYKVSQISRVRFHPQIPGPTQSSNRMEEKDTRNLVADNI